MFNGAINFVGSGTADQPGGVQCEEQTLSGGDGDGWRRTLGLHMCVRQRGAEHRGLTECHCCSG